MVTGGAGFIGRHLVADLLAAGYEVGVLDWAPRPQGAPGFDDIRYFQLRVEDPAIEDVLGAFRPSAVIHAAAQTSVANSWKDPMLNLASNVEGTLNLVRQVCRRAVSKIVYLSSAAVYGVPSALPITENHPTNPISPYGASKLAAEYFIRVYCEQASIQYVILRLANVYGPGQEPTSEAGVVSIFADRLGRGLPLLIEGTGDQTRDFVFVKDVSDAIRKAMGQEDSATLNIGSGTEISVNDLAKAIGRALGCRSLLEYVAPRPGDIPRSVFEISATRRLLHWETATPLESGLKLTLDSVAAKESRA